MQKVGVEAIVAGLSSFLGDMGKVDKSIKDLIPGSNLLSRAFEGVGSVVEWLTGSVFRVLEHALGEILADAFQWAASKAMELVESAIELGGELQSLKIRLDNLNFIALTDQEKEAANAMELVNQKTQEQIDWIQKLNLKSPFTTEDISTVYGMARSYGFADEEARDFVETLSNWTAGMDLGGDAMTNVIRQFGQMRNKGKIMQQDLNALAEGGMVPVNNILDIMKEKTGLTGKAFDEFKKSGEGVEMFIQTFTEYVDTNFANAAEKANRTFKNATNTFKDMLATFMAKGITLPLMDILGEKVASVNDAFMVVNADIQAAFDRIGVSIGNIVTGLFDLGGGADGMAEGFLAAVEGVADWLETHQGDIQAWLQDGIAWIRDVAIPKVIEFKDFLFGTDDRKGAIQSFIDWLMNTGVPFIQNDVIPVIQNIIYIIQSLQPTLVPLQDLFLAVAEVIATAFDGDTPKSFADFVTNTLVPAIQGLTQFITEHRDTLATLLKVWIAFEIIGTIVGVATSLIVKGLVAVISILTLILTPLGLLQKLIMAIYTAFNWLSALLMTSVGTAFGIFVIAIVGAIAQLKFLEFSIRSIIGGVQIMAQAVVQWFTLIKANITKTIQDAVNAIRNGDWLGAGKAIIDGMYRGIIINAHLIISTLVNLAKNALSAAKATLGIKSPSTEFFNIGEQLMQGFANGITATADLAAKAMQGATAGAISIGAMAPARLASAMVPGTVANNTTNNFTLNMHSSAQKEPVIADFEMMRSLAT